MGVIKVENIYTKQPIEIGQVPSVGPETVEAQPEPTPIEIKPVEVQPTPSPASVDDLMVVYKAATPCVSPDAVAKLTGLDKEKVHRCLKALEEIGVINPICVAATEVAAEFTGEVSAKVGD